MTPGARAAAAIEILDAWEAGEGRAEPLLRAWGRASRFAGAKDRRAVADIVYDCLRRRRSLAARSGARGGRGLVLGLALAEGWPLESVFSGEGHAPAPPSAVELTGEEGPPPPDHPDWLEPLLRESLGPHYDAAMAALAARAPVDLRVNRLRTDREGARAALAAEGIETAPLPEPDALRAPPGAPAARSRAYLDGLVELQDASSQAGAAFAAPQPGETILDFCAGGGGKALAFASMTGGGARILAHDVAPARMRDLPTRAARAGAKIELVGGEALAALRGRCDLVYVDAPCSGSGAWRRDPEAKWSLTPERLLALRAAQQDAFAAALAHVRPGGRIAYATCSVLSAENQAQAATFSAEYALPAPEEMTRWPGEAGDGFYCAVFSLPKRP